MRVPGIHSRYANIRTRNYTCTGKSAPVLAVGKSCARHAPAWSRPSRRRRTARTGTATRPAPRRTCAAGLPSPVDDQGVARRPDCRAAAPVMPRPPRGLHLGDQAAEVSRRPGIARRPRSRQQPLRANPALAAPHLLGNQAAHLLAVMTPVPGRRRTAAGIVPLHDPLHGLVRRAAHRRSAPVATHLQVGGQYVHPFPRVLQ